MITLVIATPINSFISGRYIKVSLMKARDRRITVMTELIGAVQVRLTYPITREDRMLTE
jgi:hypothetical protein